jgi:hypothetical protein
VSPGPGAEDGGPPGGQDLGTGPACEPRPEVCNGRDDDCDGEVDEGDGACLDACCNPSLRCSEGGRCEVLPCDGQRCGDGSLCCGAGTICWLDRCIDPGAACETSLDCPSDTFCEPDAGRCLPEAGRAACEYIPPPGVFEPVLACRWTSAGLPFDNRADVVATPLVANLTDDNGDGRTDRNDVPDLVFLTYDFTAGCCNQPSTLRIVHGECEPDGSMRTLASLSDIPLTNDTGMAIADLDGDGVPEIVAVMLLASNGNRPQGTVAFRRTADDGSAWEVMWRNDLYPTFGVHTRGGPTISVANLDGEGPPEVVIGNVVLRGDTGALLWDGVVTGGGTGGIGNNAFLGPASIAADVDLDGFMEVLAGNTLYSHTGEVLRTLNYGTGANSTNSICDGQLPCDGYNAVVNWDDDPEAELVTVRMGQVTVWQHTGQRIWRANIPTVSCRKNGSSANEGGPPTVADFDGDGFPDIGVASSDFYVVLSQRTCGGDDWEARGCAARNILWQSPNQDCSSRVTGSSVFDFDGDGRAEVVYADERNLRIYDGPTGRVLFNDPTHRSHTRIEMPVIVDINNDGNADIVVPANRSGRGEAPGVSVWSDASGNWVRTRRIWNQHAYHVTNVSEDGAVPLRASSNWLNPRLNNFRQNVQPDNLFAAPDLAIDDFAVAYDGAKCPFEITVQVRVAVRNQGALSVPAGVPVQIDILKEGSMVWTGRVTTTQRLFPGTLEVFSVVADAADGVLEPPLTVIARVDPDNRWSECDETNNGARVDELDCGE